MTRLLLGLLALAIPAVQGPTLPGVNTPIANRVKDVHDSHDSGSDAPASVRVRSLDPSAAPVSLLGLAPLGEVRTGLGLLDAGPQTHYPRADRSRPLTVELLDVTAYCPTGHPTASGVWPREGMAAGNRWPFGTRLLVQTVGEVVITDRIGHGSDLDLYRNTCTAALRFGRHHLLVQEEQ